MGQKVNPHGLRVGVIKDWDSKWYAEADFADCLVEDYQLRKFLKKKLLQVSNVFPNLVYVCMQARKICRRYLAGLVSPLYLQTKVL